MLEQCMLNTRQFAKYKYTTSFANTRQPNKN